jgi:GH15 family glucan-1,4-alpha-glucosidase
MSSLKKKVAALTDTSRQVLSDCALPNGAIVAANSDATYYPREAANYRFVWPRDAAFVAAAAGLIGLTVSRPFFSWLEKYPEDFKKEGLLYSNYATNGRIGSLGKLFEPDQMGSLLWAIDDYLTRAPREAAALEPLVKRIANGLTSAWGGRFFVPNTADLWEDGYRQTSTRIENNFTYSLAACCQGLRLAHARYKTRAWKKTANEMQTQIDAAWGEEISAFSRNHGRITDRNIDASLLGLVWPFEICAADDKRIISTVDRIEEALVEHGGVHRYQFDYFDSEGTAWEGGGAWPVLNFWMAIYWMRRGNRRRALAYFQWVLERVDTYIPEQIFNDFRIGIYPLAWSHAMFVLAANELNLLPV